MLETRAGFFFGEIAVREYSGKTMKVDEKYTLILQLAGGFSIQRFSILLAVISEPTLMKACHCLCACSEKQVLRLVTSSVQTILSGLPTKQRVI